MTVPATTKRLAVDPCPCDGTDRHDDATGRQGGRSAGRRVATWAVRTALDSGFRRDRPPG